MYLKKYILCIIVFLLSIKRFSAEEIKKKVENAENHLCSKLESYVEDTEVTFNETYQETIKEWCFNIPPRCTRYRTQFRIINKTIPVSKTRTVFECCEGYEKKQDVCVAVCKDGCFNGKCVKPNSCSCSDGWRGSNCSLECEDGWYGEGCKMYCSCKNGAICDKKNGICYCPPGFVGTFCESICPNESYGKHCENECKCLNGGRCNLSELTCDCPPGYIGEHCEKQCEEGFYGTECSGNCTCNEQSTVFCNPIDGKCMCVPGWRGDSCFKKCDLNTWGVHCSNKCECPFNAMCDHISGNCSCRPGWHGPQCEEKCPVGFFGKECKMKCPDCLLQSGSCHHVTGWCNCPAGARGSNCDLECPDNKYGDNCNNDCTCTNNSTCDPITGNCLCMPGWIGEDCSLPCSTGFYGLNCSFICNCTDNYTCDFIDGTCKCEDDSEDPLCTNKMVQNYNTSTFTDEALAFSDLSIILLEGSLVVGLILFIFFVFCIFKNIKRPTSSLHNENTSTTNVIPVSRSPKNTSFRFTNPNYESKDILENFNKRSSQLFPSANNFKKDEDIELGGVEFGIPDCDKASSKTKSNISIYFNNDLSKKESKGEVISPQITYSNSAQIICFSQDEANAQENVYADVEYETRDSKKSEDAMK